MTETQIKQKCDELAQLLIQKNRDYGDAWNRSPYLVQHLDPSVVIMVRISDKLERLRSLLWKEESPSVSSESVCDTVLDIAGYCIGWLCRHQEENQ